jgi:hypothetical protein
MTTGTSVARLLSMVDYQGPHSTEYHLPTTAGAFGTSELPHHDLVNLQRLLTDRATGTPEWSDVLRVLVTRRQLLEAQMARDVGLSMLHPKVPPRTYDPPQ